MSDQRNLGIKAHTESRGFSVSGWLMLLVVLILFTIVFLLLQDLFEPSDFRSSVAPLTGFLLVLAITLSKGLFVLQPNESAVLLLFGSYQGTVRRTGLRWTNPFCRRVKASLRARNLVSETLKVNDRLGNPIEIAGIIVWRIADTAQAMLRRQQAEAVIGARQKIVQGAVTMVEMALAQLQERGIIEFDPERKAAMVSNLLVVLCGESDTQPVINTGTLYH